MKSNQNNDRRDLRKTSMISYCCARSATAFVIFMTFCSCIYIIFMMSRVQRRMSYPAIRRATVHKIINPTTTARRTRTSRTVSVSVSSTSSSSTTSIATTTRTPGPLPKEVKWFKKQMSKKEKDIYVDLMKKFADACDHFKITYMIIWGTLLGSYRHHGFIPWDDDVDFYVDFYHKEDMYKVVTYMGKDYQLWTNSKQRWKISNKKRSWKTLQPWKWPFIDLSFYKTSWSYIYDSSTNWGTYKKSDVFPLILRPFENQWFKAPRTFKPILRGAANLKHCCTRSWNHRREYSLKVKCTACSKLHSTFPFVLRRDLGNGSIAENLMYQGKVRNTIVTAKQDK